MCINLYVLVIIPYIFGKNINYFDYFLKYAQTFTLYIFINSVIIRFVHLSVLELKSLLSAQQSERHTNIKCLYQQHLFCLLFTVGHSALFYGKIKNNFIFSPPSLGFS